MWEATQAALKRNRDQLRPSTLARFWVQMLWQGVVQVLGSFAAFASGVAAVLREVGLHSNAGVFFAFVAVGVTTALGSRGLMTWTDRLLAERVERAAQRTPGVLGVGSIGTPTAVPGPASSRPLGIEGSVRPGDQGEESRSSTATP